MALLAGLSPLNRFLIFCVFGFVGFVGIGFFVAVTGMLFGIVPTSSTLTPVPDSGMPEIDIILDISGSMAGEIDGEVKLEIAKEILKSFIYNVTGSNIGLRLLGVTDCDTKQLITIGKNDPDAFVNAITPLQPSGLTPIELSLTEAKNDFKLNGKKAIILISDGQETCNGDPCKVAKEMANEGISVIHTVGFDLAEDGVQDLKCVAAATGGKYFDAKNKQQLLDAVNQSYVEITSSYCEELSNPISKYLCHFGGGRN
ncbi:MAG: VWA domain-containing protein [archaeon]